MKDGASHKRVVDPEDNSPSRGLYKHTKRGKVLRAVEKADAVRGSKPVSGKVCKQRAECIGNCCRLLYGFMRDNGVAYTECNLTYAVRQYEHESEKR